MYFFFNNFNDEGKRRSRIKKPLFRFLNVFFLAVDLRNLNISKVSLTKLTSTRASKRNILNRNLLFFFELCTGKARSPPLNKKASDSIDHCEFNNYSKAILTNWTLKMHRDQWAQIALRVLIWVVVSWETTAGVVLDRSNVFNISGVLALARYPNSVHLQEHGKCKSPITDLRKRLSHAYGMLFPFVNVLDVFLEILGHVVWQFGGIVVAVRNPSVDSVQLQEYTRGALVVVVVVLQGAWTILLDVHIAHGSWWWWLSVITVVDILSSARNLTRCSVFCVGLKRGLNFSTGNSSSNYMIRIYDRIVHRSEGFINSRKIIFCQACHAKLYSLCCANLFHRT